LKVTCTKHSYTYDLSDPAAHCAQCKEEEKAYPTMGSMQFAPSAASQELTPPLMKSCPGCDKLVPIETFKYCSSECEKLHIERLAALMPWKQSMFVEPLGRKDDNGKPQYYAMPLEVLERLATVFVFGETKYETFNCLNDFKNGDRRLFDATMRHLKECQVDPTAIDKESGCLHGYQAAFSILMRTFHAEKRSQKKGTVSN
jgi:hypothetical protein